jgi:hypothetical protein
MSSTERRLKITSSCSREIRLLCRKNSKMKSWKKRLIGAGLVVGMFLSPVVNYAQDQQSDAPPKPAARALLPLPDLSGDQRDTDPQKQTLLPDRGPISGVQNPTLGTPEVRHSYWISGIRYSNIVRSNSSYSTSNSGWNTTSYLSGDLSALGGWSHSLLSLNYSGGGFTSSDRVQGSGQYHQFAAVYEIDQQRWRTLLVNQFSYLPESQIGFGGTTGLAYVGITGTLAVSLPGLQNLFLPGQTILTATGPRYSNASAAQLTYEVSRRGSITVAGVLGFLRFTNSGNIDSTTDTLNAGYNYAITRKDTVGVSYRFGEYHFSGTPQALGDHVAQFVYGRRITGKLALNLAGGPEVTTFRVPISGSARKVSGLGSGVSLTYAFRQGSVALSYLRGVSNGSGVFTGARSELGEATVSQQLTRLWKGTLNFGYAKNSQIVAESGLTYPRFDTWLAGAGLSRPLGRTRDVSLGYQAQLQAASAGLCAIRNCSSNYTLHEVSLSFQWRTGPQVLR